MAKVDMPVLTGTDNSSMGITAVPPGFSLHDNMADLVWAGLSSLHALRGGDASVAGRACFVCRSTP